MGTVPPETVEHLIVGGGVIGLSLAFELSRRGRTVELLERGEAGDGASSVAAGMLAPVSEAESDSDELVAFGQDSLQRYPGFVRQIERGSTTRCAYRADGTMWVALNRDDRSDLEHLQATLAGRGLEAKPISAAEVLAAEPHLSPRVTGGLLVPDDHQVDPRALTRALSEAIRTAGGRVSCGLTVERIETDGRVSGRGRDGERFERRAERVILTAGAWSDEIASPIEPLGLRPVKGQLLRLRGPRLVTRVLRTPEIYLVPREDGELLVGATAEEMGFDTSATAGAALDLLRHAFELLPGIYDLELDAVDAGLRPALIDHLPSIGPVGDGMLFLAVGHFRHGVLLAPATAHYLAEWLDSGRPQAALEPFLPQRHAPDAELATAEEG